MSESNGQVQSAIEYPWFESGRRGVRVLVGPTIYLLSQAIYFPLEHGTAGLPRLIRVIRLGVAAAPAFRLPAFAVTALLVVILLAVAFDLSGR